MQAYRSLKLTCLLFTPDQRRISQSSTLSIGNILVVQRANQSIGCLSFYSMGKRKQQFYAVKVGRKPGIYNTWDEAKSQVERFGGAIFKKFELYEQAAEFCNGSAPKRLKQTVLVGGLERTPSAPEYRLEFDGAARGNPGPAGVGAVVIDNRTHVQMGKVCQSIGKATNNQAEYQGLILGLKAALTLGISKLKVVGDSMLVVNQVNGSYKVKDSALQSLHKQVCRLKEQFNIFQIEHVPREENRVADELSNRALDCGGWAGIRDNMGNITLVKHPPCLDADSDTGAASALPKAGALEAEATGVHSNEGSAVSDIGAAAVACSRETGGAIKPGATYRLEFDGAARGNPGPAGLGAVITEQGTGTEVARMALPLGRATNNQAEYSGLLYGMQAAVALGIQRLHVFGDSKLVVMQVDGKWAVNNAILQVYHAQVMKLKPKFTFFKIEHVLREYNKAADALSNEALDSGGWQGVRVPGGKITPLQLPHEVVAAQNGGTR